MNTFDKPSHASTSQAFVWWRSVRDLWTNARRHKHLSPEDAVRMAEEVGLDPDLFVRVVGEADGPAALLYRKLRAFDIDPADIYRLSPLLLADLERNCANCADKERCAADMKDDPNPPGWESYCPNSGTLNTLR